jgi:hypothetical protein
VSREEALEKFPRFVKSCEYLAEHAVELREQFPDMWVAIDDGEVAVTSSSLDGVLTGAEEQGLSPAWTLFQFLSTKPSPPHPFHFG